MVLSLETSHRIIKIAQKNLGKPYDFKKFDCIQFILSVYNEAGIHIDRFGGQGYPPEDIHLTQEEFDKMPIGHIVFFKRKANTKDRVWTHAAIIMSSNELIHCSRHFGNQVVVSCKSDFMEIYNLAPKH